MPMNESQPILIGLIARREALFYRDVLAQLQAPELRQRFQFLAFHAGCVSILRDVGLVVHDFHEWRKQFERRSDITQFSKTYGMAWEDVVLHERLTHNRHDVDWLANKTVLYTTALEALFEKIKPQIYIMELGGFIANLLPYLICRRRQITHYTIEPAFYPKRCFWVKDSLMAKIPTGMHDQVSTDAASWIAQCLRDFTEKKMVNAPDKDRHHFADMTLKKLFSNRNAQRLWDKLLDKYVRGYAEEYDAIFHVFAYNVWKWRNRHRFVKYYQSLASVKKPFIYYPLHVPLDIQLTVRCPQYLDQALLLKKVRQQLPQELHLVTKEHPASIGAYEMRAIDKELQSGQITLLAPNISSHDVIDQAAYILTVNSKVGIEAILRGKSTAVLGDAMYAAEGITTDITLDQLAQLQSLPAVNPKTLQGFLNRAYNWSLPGELYEHSPTNLTTFAESLQQISLSKSRI